MKTLPKVKLRLVGHDGKAGWTHEQIKAVLDLAMASDYDHLLQTIMAHCED